MGAQGVRNRFRICFAASSDRMLIASILAWLSIPKTMHIETALTQLMMS